MTFQEDLTEEIGEIAHMLLSKNTQYGNSALEPVRIFSHASIIEGIQTRIDDKLSRLKNGTVDTEDTELDLIGYLILLRIAKKHQKSDAKILDYTK